MAGQGDTSRGGGRAALAVVGRVLLMELMRGVFMRRIPVPGVRKCGAKVAGSGRVGKWLQSAIWPSGVSRIRKSLSPEYAAQISRRTIATSLVPLCSLIGVGRARSIARHVPAFGQSGPMIYRAQV